MAVRHVELAVAGGIVPGCGCPTCAERVQEGAGRAEELLLSMLDDKQREDYVQAKFFEVKAKSGTEYAIIGGAGGGPHTRVAMLGPRLPPMLRPAYMGFDPLPKCFDRVSRVFCVYPRVQVPLADELLAYKLWIEGDEEGFLNQAF